MRRDGSILKGDLRRMALDQMDDRGIPSLLVFRDGVSVLGMEEISSFFYNYTKALLSACICYVVSPGVDGYGCAFMSG